MFGFFKKNKKESGYTLVSPVNGKTVPLSEVNDPTFSQKLLGDGVAVIPSDGKVYAPCDGKIEMVFDTLHAVNMIADFGAEVLIHVGLDTVTLKGDGFESHVSQGQEVKKGDLLLTADLDKIKSAGYETIIPVIICNSDEYESISSHTNVNVNVGDDILSIEGK